MRTDNDNRWSRVSARTSGTKIGTSALHGGDSSPPSARVGLAASGKRRANGAVQRLARQSALLGLFLATCGALLAQSYTIDWQTMDGGGGTSTGGVYSVTGTVGQPDAGPVMTGGTYSLQGGFWALPVAVQTTNAPTLLIAPAAPGFATISWDPPTPGFVLQASPTLVPPAWTNAPSGGSHPITVPATFPAIFYRLHKP